MSSTIRSQTQGGPTPGRSQKPRRSQRLLKLRRSARPQKKDQTKCVVCEKILSASSSGPTTVELGTWDDAVVRSNCHHHRDLLRLCVNTIPEDKVERISVTSPPWTQQVSVVITWNQMGGPGLSFKEIDFQVLSIPRGLQKPGLSQQGKLVNPHWIDSSIARRWEQRCRRLHGTACLEPLRFRHLSTTRPTWLIDVWQQCLTRASPAHDYVALSYVWGGNHFFKALRSNINELQIPRSLSAHQGADIPRTIRDAMTLAEKIGNRYLWVDSLCIVQDDDDHKNGQIASMAAIYANASLTIIAASGTDANAGLPGFPSTSTPRSVRQQIFTLKNGLKVVKLQRPTDGSWRKSQPWGRRTWTIQEHIFSKRRLVCEDGWVRWHCDRATWQEDSATAQIGSSDPTKEVWQDSTDLRRALCSGIPTPKTLNDTIRQFAETDLTYPEDILPAFSGIATAISPFYQGGFISGLPVAFFYIAILWRPLGRLSRRKATALKSQLTLPSWSWAGWRGILHRFAWNASQDFAARGTGFVIGPAEYISPLFEWSYRETLKGPAQLIPNVWYEYGQKFAYGKYDGPCPQGWTRHDVSEFGSRIKDLNGEITYQGTKLQHLYKHQSKPGSVFKYPIPLLSGTEAPIIRQPVPYISCTTRRAYLFGDSEPKPRRLNIELSDPGGRWAGVLAVHALEQLNLNTTLPTAAPRFVFELVEVAQSRAPFTAQDRARDPFFSKYPLDCQEKSTGELFYEYYFVLWIEWVGEIAYRKGIGRVEKSRWEDTERKAVTLILG